MMNPELKRPWYDYSYNITIYDKGFCWKVDKKLKPKLVPAQIMRFILLLSLYGVLLSL